MKKYYPLCLLFLLTLSCSTDFNENLETPSSNNNTTYSTQTNSVISLNTIVSQLVSTYQIQTLNNKPTTLTQTITLLDTIALQNTAFSAIKPVNYSVTTTTQAQRFLQNYATEYNTLESSTAVKSYFELILAKETSADTLLRDINADTYLTST